MSIKLKDKSFNAKYSAYPEYKESEVEWLDYVPSHWSIPSLKMLIDVRDGTHETPSYVVQSEISFPLVTSKDVTSGQLIFDQCKLISKTDYLSIIQRSKVDVGDILMPMIGTVGSPIIVKGRDDFAIKNLALFKTSNNQNINTVFLNYFLQSNECEIQFSLEARGGVQNFVSLGTLRDLGFLHAPYCEQEKIANFLDHETAKIDTLIEKQQQLIKLLKEKRQAVISHAVTKGLNSEASMCDSGVEWLGEIPEHWALKNYRYATQIYRGKFGHRPRNDPAFYDGKYPFIQTGDVAQAGKNITKYTQTLNDRGIGVSQKFPAGTLVMTIAANIGDTAILGFEAYAPDSIVGFKPNEDVDLEFLRYSLMAALPALEKTSTQSTQANLNIDRIGTVKASFPPIREQQEIVKVLDALHEQYANIDIKAIEAIKLMKERRTALISAAVTGKIDVRNWVMPTPSSTNGATND